MFTGELPSVEVIRANRGAEVTGFSPTLFDVQGRSGCAGDILWLLQIHGSLQLHPVHLGPHPVHSECVCVYVCVYVCV